MEVAMEAAQMVAMEAAKERAQKVVKMDVKLAVCTVVMLQLIFSTLLLCYE